jgi:hypothetical protein
LSAVHCFHSPSGSPMWNHAHTQRFVDLEASLLCAGLDEECGFLCRCGRNEERGCLCQAVGSCSVQMAVKRC